MSNEEDRPVVVTFGPFPVHGVGALAGLRRMTIAEAGEVLRLADRIPKHGRIVDVSTLSEVSR